MLAIESFAELKGIMEKDSGESLDMYEHWDRLFINGQETELMLRFFNHTSTLVIARIKVKNRRTGVATSILDWLKEYAKQNKIANIALESTTTHEINAFAEKHGFEKIEQQGMYYEGVFFGNWNLSLNN